VKEACGVFAVYAPGRAVSHLTFDGLYALQHRGQESAGMAVSDGESITALKDMGLVASVFDERKLSGLSGHLAIGHTRYSTHGKSDWMNAQPVYCSSSAIPGGFAVAHNGNLTNTEELAARAGMMPGFVLADTGVVAELILQHHQAVAEGAAIDLTETLGKVLPWVEGAYSLTLLDAGRIYGIRDPHGFRPLCIGRLGPEQAPEGWVFASESPALDVVGATFVREVAPGELVSADGDGLRSVQLLEKKTERLCIFEFVYFARPDSVLHGREIHGTRRQMGKLLAEQAPVEADLVMGVPDSGVPAAEGFARASGIPYGQGLVKNRYIGRTFIAPDQAARANGVRRKLNPLKENISGKRLVVVDDSIVRGTTTKAIVQMLREAGAAEVHLRISSPPFQWPCYYGIDTPSRDELLAAGSTLEEIRVFLGADSIAYITIENLRIAVGKADEGLCDACLTGTYPVPVKLRGADEAAQHPETVPA
jgi:amidophosphoribosyltransferase